MSHYIQSLKNYLPFLNTNPQTPKQNSTNDTRKKIAIATAGSFITLSTIWYFKRRGNTPTHQLPNKDSTLEPKGSLESRNPSATRPEASRNQELNISKGFTTCCDPAEMPENLLNKKMPALKLDRGETLSKQGKTNEGWDTMDTSRNPNPDTENPFNLIDTVSDFMLRMNESDINSINQFPDQNTTGHQPRLVSEVPSFPLTEYLQLGNSPPLDTPRTRVPQPNSLATRIPSPRPDQRKTPLIQPNLKKSGSSQEMPTPRRT